MRFTLSALLTLAFIHQTQATTFPAATAGAAMSIQFHDNPSAKGFAVIRDGGFKMMRRGLYWSSGEKTKGVYNFDGFDTAVQFADANGMYVSATIYGSNSLYEAQVGGITTAAGREGYAKFAAAAAAHYKGKRIIWEIWNEPNLKSFWNTKSNSVGIADEYTELVKVAVPAIKKADPTAIVVAGSISALWSQSFSWFDECVKQGLLTSGIDAVSVHPYGFNIPESAASGGYPVIRKKMDAAGASTVGIVNTEVGYDLNWIVERQKYTANEAQEVQSWMLVRQQLVDLMSGLRYSNWYNFVDSSGIWPIVNSNYTPRPAYNAALVFSTELQGFAFKARIATASTSDYLLLFEKPDGSQKIAAWTVTSPALNLPAAKQLDINATGSGTVDVKALNGDEFKLTINANRVTATLSAAPQFLTLPLALGETNVALKRPVVVSTGQASAKNLTDGVISTNSRWLSGSNTYPQSVTVDLGAPRTISEIDYLQYAQRTGGYQVEVLANGVWKTVVFATPNSAQNIAARFTPIQATQVRFTITKGSLYQKAYELKVIGK